MAETTIENRVCRACGAQVRAQSLFCYNCGKSVAPDLVADLPQREKPADRQNGFGQSVRTTVEDAADRPIPKPDLIEQPPLRPAAPMRRKSKLYQPKRVEVIWEEYESAPNGWFIFAAILLALFAAGVLYLAIYLK